MLTGRCPSGVSLSAQAAALYGISRALRRRRLQLFRHRARMLSVSCPSSNRRRASRAAPIHVVHPPRRPENYESLGRFVILVLPTLQ